MPLHYEVHGRSGWYPIDLYYNAEEGSGEKTELREGAVVYVKTRKFADEIARKLNEALIKGHVEATERLGL